MSWRNLFNAICAYYYALRGQTGSIPEVYAAHRMNTVNTLAPGKPMIGLIENQVYLAQGEWARVLGRSPGLLALCEALHYDLAALHLRPMPGWADRTKASACSSRLWRRPPRTALSCPLQKISGI